MKLGSHCFLIALVFGAGSGQGRETPTDEEVTLAQAAVWPLWTAGEYDEATRQTRALYEKFPSHQRGKAAFFHIGNLLENQKSTEAQTPKELEGILEEARRQYRSSLDSVADQAPTIREQSRQAVERVDRKLADLRLILEGKMEFREASEKLSDFEASRAAVAYLAGAHEPSSTLDHEIAFLMLVHQRDYVEALTARLTDAYRQLREAHPELFERAYAHYAPMLEKATRDAVALATQAIARHPDSDHRIDYHVFLGDAYHATALLHVAERDGSEGRDAQLAAAHLAAVIENLRKAKEQNAAIIKLADEYRGRITSPETVQGEEAERLRTWEKHKRQAQERMVELDRLLRSFQPEAGVGPARPPSFDVLHFGLAMMPDSVGANDYPFVRPHDPLSPLDSTQRVKTQ